MDKAIWNQQLIAVLQEFSDRGGKKISVIIPICMRMYIYLTGIYSYHIKEYKKDIPVLNEAL